MWSDWYTQYLNADYPRLIIRFEDTLYRLPEVIDKVRECIGMGKKEDPFVYHISSPKVHGAPTDYVRGLAKYVSTDNRHRGLNADDRVYAREALNPELLRIFNYKQVPLDVPPEDLKEPFSGWRIGNKKKDNWIGALHMHNKATTGNAIRDPNGMRAAMFQRRQNSFESLEQVKAKGEAMKPQLMQN